MNDSLGLTDVELAYLAGIIDGEGTIGIYRLRGNVYHLRLVVANTNSALIEWVHARVGGSIAPQSDRNPRHKPAWQVVVYGRDAARVIGACRRFLVVKGAQADLGVLFVQGYVSFRGSRVTDIESRRRLDLYERSLALNGGWRRGRPKKSDAKKSDG